MGMFDAYDDLAKGVVSTTYNTAEKYNHNPVDVQHLFFVLMNQSNNAIVEVLSKTGVNIDTIKLETKKSLMGLLSVQAEFSISEDLHKIFAEAVEVAKKMNDNQVSIYHIFVSLLQSKNKISAMLAEQGLSSQKVWDLVSKMEKSHVHSDQTMSVQNDLGVESNTMDKYSEDLTALAKAGKLKQVIGRDKELKKLIEILSRKEKNNAIVLGESGVGKTSVVEYLAQKIVAGEVPDFLKDKQILSINLGSLLSGTKFRGDFEEKITNIIKAVKDSNGKILLFVDEIHNISGAGKTEGSMDLGELLKPELSSGNIQLIGATTTAEYRQTIEKNTALSRRFETMTLAEPTVQDSITILRGIEHSFESHHGVSIYDSALVAAVELSDRYIKNRKLPDKAINIVDQAAAKVKIAMTSLPDSLSEMQISANQLQIEKNSLLQERDETQSAVLKKEYEGKLIMIDKEISDLVTLYEQKKTQRTTLKTLFDTNQTLKKLLEDLEAQVKIYEAQSDLEKVSELRYGTILTTQKEILANKDQIVQIQKESGFVIKDSVEKEDIAQVVSEQTGIPLTKMLQGESEKLANLEQYLSTKVIGQEDAVAQISDAIRRARVGLKDPKKPIGSFLFLGPTGVGKTELAKALAEFLFSNKNAMVRLNMSEFKEENSTSKLIGSPPGYVGYEKGGELTEAIRRNPYSVILLDEVEKAHQGVFDLFLQVLDDGMLNDSMGNTVDFKNTIIIMTSNIGSQQIMDKLEGNQTDLPDLYTTAKSDPVDVTIENNEDHKPKRNRRPHKKTTETTEYISPIDELKEELAPILQDFFRPEFLNRLDSNVVFNPISPEMLKNILDLKLEEQIQLVQKATKISLVISNEAKNFLAHKGRDPANGARPINRALQEYLISPLSKQLVSNVFGEGDTVSVNVQNGTLSFKKN